MNQKGFTTTLIVLGFLLITGIGAGAYYLGTLNKSNLPSAQSQSIDVKTTTYTPQPSVNPTPTITTPPSPSPSDTSLLDNTSLQTMIDNCEVIGGYSSHNGDKGFRLKNNQTLELKDKSIEEIQKMLDTIPLKCGDKKEKFSSFGKFIME